MKSIENSSYTMERDGVLNKSISSVLMKSQDLVGDCDDSDELNEL